MNVNHLDAAELEIEFFIRNLKGPFIKQFSELKKHLNTEAKDGHSPDVPHRLALANPKREITTCCRKLKEIRELFHSKLAKKDKSDVLEISLDDIALLQSKLMHVEGRLQRLSSIESIAEAAMNLKSIDQCFGNNLKLY